jgi:hypothetical protein
MRPSMRLPRFKIPSLLTGIGTALITMETFQDTKPLDGQREHANFLRLRV